ncbi:MAG: EutN/CcmL family microcompartment protein [Planctomycetia bacterium]
MVTGSVVATQKTESMTGHKMLVVEPYRLDEKTRDRLVSTGRTFIAVDTLGAGIVELGGLDAIAFAGGIGENSPLTRAAVLAGLDDLGIAIDSRANDAQASGDRQIGAKTARVKVWVIPTNEELIVARQTRDLLAGGSHADSHIQKRGG